jgi:hypothetical protein
MVDVELVRIGSLRARAEKWDVGIVPPTHGQQTLLGVANIALAGYALAVDDELSAALLTGEVASFRREYGRGLGEFVIATVKGFERAARKIAARRRAGKVENQCGAHRLPLRIFRSCSIQRVAVLIKSASFQNTPQSAEVSTMAIIP